MIEQAVERELIFSIGNLEVGVFKERSYPETSGQYRYEPFRGPGHYELSTRLRAGTPTHCHYDIEFERVSFTVIACPEYGLIELTDFKRASRGKETGNQRSE